MTVCFPLQHRDRRADSTSDHAHLMQGTLRKKRQEQLHSHLHHLYLRVDAIDHTFPEDCEVFFFLSGQHLLFKHDPCTVVCQFHTYRCVQEVVGSS